MKKLVHIFIFASTFFSLGAMAQGAYFKVVPNSVSMEIKRKGGDSLTLFYRAVYIDSGNSTFKGTVFTMYKTNKNGASSSSKEVFSTGNNFLNNGDTIEIFAFIRVTSDYFNTGDSNIIIIWPTGDRGNGKTVECMDSVTYPQMINITGWLSGINTAKNVLDRVRIFPNPASTYLNLAITDPTQKLKMIRVTDMTGKEMIYTNLNLDHIDVSQLKPGSYFLEMNFADNRKATYPFIIGR